MNAISKAAAGLSTAMTKGYVNVTSFINRNSAILLLVFGLIILTAGLADLSFAYSGSASGTGTNGPNFDQSRISDAVSLLFDLIEGAFGALVMVVAGLAAIISAAMGAYRAALGMLVVAVGAFILRSLVSLFFGTFAVSNGTAISGNQG